MTGIEACFIIGTVLALLFSPKSPLEKMADLEKQGKQVPHELRIKAISQAESYLDASVKKYDAIEKRKKEIQKRRELKSEERRKRAEAVAGWIQ